MKLTEEGVESLKENTSLSLGGFKLYEDTIKRQQLIRRRSIVWSINRLNNPENYRSNYPVKHIIEKILNKIFFWRKQSNLYHNDYMEWDKREVQKLIIYDYSLYKFWFNSDATVKEWLMDFILDVATLDGVEALLDLDIIDEEMKIDLLFSIDQVKSKGI